MTTDKPPWDERKIERLARKILDELPAVGGCIGVESQPEEIWVTADRLGYLRLGARMVLGATRPSTMSWGIDGTLDMTPYEPLDLEENGKVPIIFKCVEDASELLPQERGWVAETIARILGYAAMIVLLALVLIGAGTVLSWLFR